MLDIRCSQLPSGADQLDLRCLPDTALLALLRPLARDSQERAAICEVLVDRYAGLVRACVRPYLASPEPAEDLIQVGYIGLLKAISNYDPAVGENLAAYAMPCISGEIKRHFRDKRWQVRVPRQAQELLLEMRVAGEELTQELGRVPADHEIAARLGVTEDDVGQAREAHLVFTAYSLDAPLSDQDDPAELASTLGEEDHAVEHALDMEAVRVHMDELPEREQRVLLLRFWGNLTQAEIGDRLGISQMHVSRLMTRALKILRDRLTSEPAESAVTIRQRSRRLAS